jgi:hypothetical protein
MLSGSEGLSARRCGAWRSALKRVGVALPLALALVAITAATAQAHKASITFSCTGVTFTFKEFPNKPNNEVREELFFEGEEIEEPFSFNGSSGSNTIPLSLPEGEHEIFAFVTWNTNGVSGELHASAVVTCPGHHEPPSTCPNNSIVSNFNGTKIPGGDYIWFNSVLKPRGVPSSGGTITFTGQTVKFGSTTESVPDGTITFSPSATTATTKFNGGASRWETVVPVGFGDNVFLSGLGFHVPAGGLPGGISPVTWTGNFTTTGGITLSWQWGAAVYFPTFTNAGILEYEFLNVKPVHSTSLDAFHNGDQAGTPENSTVKKGVTGGARGGGGSNFTGSYSATGHCP